jgi:hypothetical protein
MEIKIEELQSIIGGKPQNPFVDLIGKNVFIRTVTYHYTGKVERIIGDFIELSKAAWIADSGRFTEAIKNEEFDEVEVYKNPIRINTTSIVDFTEISKLQESQK